MMTEVFLFVWSVGVLVAVYVIVKRHDRRRFSVEELERLVQKKGSGLQCPFAGQDGCILDLLRERQRK